VLLKKIFIIFSLVGILNQGPLKAQLKAPSHLGIVIGYGNQSLFPFNNEVYNLSTRFVKAQMIWPFKNYQKSSLEFVFEPSYYRTEHQLNDPEFVQNNYGEDYLELKEEFIKIKQFNEISLNLGIRYLYNLGNRLRASVLISLGPTYHDKRTERLAKGMAFSDVGAIGLMYRTEKIIIDSRVSVRHVSNASIKFPNSGHNSTNFELGFIFPIKKNDKE